jgi:hypothetical protein
MLLSIIVVDMDGDGMVLAFNVLEGNDALTHTVVSPQNQTLYIGPTTTKTTIQDFFPQSYVCTASILPSLIYHWQSHA